MAKVAKLKGVSDLDWKIKKQVTAIRAHLAIVSNSTSEIDSYLDLPIEGLVDWTVDGHLA